MEDKYGTEVDPQDFMTSASDNKGHSARIYFRCQPGLASHIQKVIASKRFPYNTQGDLIRHLLKRGLHWLNTITPVAGILSQVDIIDEILNQEEFADRFKDVFERISSRIAAYMGSNEKGEAVRLVRTVQDMVKGMPEGYWKDKYTKEIKDRWGHLIKEVGNVNLVDSEEE